MLAKVKIVRIGFRGVVSMQERCEGEGSVGCWGLPAMRTAESVRRIAERNSFEANFVVTRAYTDVLAL